MDTKEIRRILRGLEVKGTYYGSDYVMSGVELILADRGYLHAITKGLYADLAGRFQTSKECIERDIRTYVKAVWEKGNCGYLEEIAGRKLEKRPTNAEFLDILVGEVEIRREKKNDSKSKQNLD